MVNTYEEFGSLSTLPYEAISTYYHEYFHFIQDFTTRFGVDSAWNTLDRLLRDIGHAQREENRIEIPLPRITSEIKEAYLNFKIQNDVLLDKTLTKKYPIPDDSLDIIKVELVKNEFIEEVAPNQIMLPNIPLRSSVSGDEATYMFGAISVLESMTYLIQFKFFGDANVPIFPYR